jgi:hypothetical protein
VSIDVGDPVAQRLVHGVFERAAPEVTGLTLAPSSFMRNTFGLLPLDVGRAHVDFARQTVLRADGRDGDAVLAGAGLGDDARLAHAAGEQDLAEAVVDLVRAGVVELVALEVDLRAAEFLGQPFSEIERRWATGIMRRKPR